MNHYLDNPYILLTPGPLSTSRTVREAMGRDWCTWDADYNTDIVQNIRKQLVSLATSHVDEYTAVLMQGSGTFSVEATLGTAVGGRGCVLIISNGAYGERMIKIAQQAKIAHYAYRCSELETPDPETLRSVLREHESITHVAMVHGETTTGMMNPLQAIAEVVRQENKKFIVDAMSTFGGIPIDVGELGIDVLVSSSNKCIQGVPGFGFVIIKKSSLVAYQGNSPSLSLDLYAQWQEMDLSGKWRFTSPTHVVRAFMQALKELAEEGGILARHKRYAENHRILIEGMHQLGFKPLLPNELRSVMITSFLYPKLASFSFIHFYEALKARGFVIYPGKIGAQETFRIGTIGDVHPHDFKRLIQMIAEVKNNGFK